MSDDIEFVNGLSVKQRHENTPDYVLANGSINCEQMVEWLKGRTGYINWQAKLSKAGKPYVSVDTWKPKEGGNREPAQRQEREKQQAAPEREASFADGPNTGFTDDEIPFRQFRHHCYF